MNDALALLVAGSNQFGVRKSSSFTGLAWAFATLTVNGAAQQTLIYGSPGNFDSPDPDLCNGNTFGPVDAAGTTAALDLLPNTCTTDSCDTITGCVHTPVADGNSCDDGVFCNGGDTCNQGHCAVHSGDPCPGTPCNTCQEAAQSCFDPPGGSGVGVRVGYLRGASAPWEVDTNERAMDRVFGAGQWSDLRLADGAGPFAVGTGNDYGFLFVEGGDSTATEFSAFLAAHGTAIATWVNAGGSLILNAAPNVGGSFSMGFGVTLNYPDPAGAVIGADSGHPVFNGPYGATGTAFTGGSFSHATVAGGSLMPIILRSPENDIVLGEQVAGNGHVLFGGMTPDFFHQPQPNAANLTANILAYAASLHHDSACIVDDNRCIIAQCDGDGSCVPVGAVSCPDDGNVCNGPESCNPATGGCVSGPPLAGGSDCEDHTFCNGTDTCDAAGHCSVHSGDPCPGTPCNTCQEAAPGCFDPPGTPCQADDSLCTVDQCTGSGGCVQVSTLSCPDDGNVCNGPESCDPAAGCVSGPPPVPACAACGDGVIDVDEDCDVGGTCIGGAAAGTPCFVNGTPCPGGTCTPFGGTGCAANCTFEHDVPYPLVPGQLDGLDILPGTSGVAIASDFLSIPLPIGPACLGGGNAGGLCTDNGDCPGGTCAQAQQTLTVGKQKNGKIPVVVKAASVGLPGIPVSTLACGCVRGIPAKTCGGRSLRPTARRCPRIAPRGCPTVPRRAATPPASRVPGRPPVPSCTAPATRPPERSAAPAGWTTSMCSSRKTPAARVARVRPRTRVRPR